MTVKNFARIFAALLMVCAVSFGLYINFSGSGPDALSSRAVMVCAVQD